MAEPLLHSSLVFPDSVTSVPTAHCPLCSSCSKPPQADVSGILSANRQALLKSRIRKAGDDRTHWKRECSMGRSAAPAPAELRKVKKAAQLRFVTSNDGKNAKKPIFAIGMTIPR